jgi:hypothetical protein
MAVVLTKWQHSGASLEMLLEELVSYVSDELRRHEDEFVTVDDRTFRITQG